MAQTSYWLGSSYYPEQFDETRWNDDFRKMADIGFNCVRMGEFAWSTYEPREGVYNLDWMRRAIELAASYGIQTILGTPSAAHPPWLRKNHPDVLGGNERGPFRYGARKGYCVNSRAFLEAVDRIVTVVLDRFGSHPHVAGWQIDNEPGYPFVCYDDNCLGRFRQWLREQYGTIEALNEAWGGAFWSHGYLDWDEIEFPTNIGDGAWNPGQRLDYRRFFSASVISYLNRQAKIMRPRMRSGQFLMTNWPNTHWSVDVFEATEEVGMDASGWDNYSAIPGITDYRAQFAPAFHHDLCRKAGPNGWFLVSEQTARMPATALQNGISLQTWSSIGHGAKGTIFFEWRPPVAGAEQGYVSVLEQDGSHGASVPQLRELTKQVASLPSDLMNGRIRSDVALIYSYENAWHGGFWHSEGGYSQHAERWYGAIKSLQRNVDVIPPGEPLESYRVVVAPRLEIIADEQAARLARFVNSGGVLILDSGAGSRDDRNRMRELPRLGLFRSLAGISVVNFAAHNAIAGNLIEGPANQMSQYERCSAHFIGQRGAYYVQNVLEEVVLNGAEALAYFEGGRMDGKPAVTVNRFGDGYVVYSALDCQDPLFYETIMTAVKERAGIVPLLSDAPPGIEIISRASDDSEYLFLLNLTPRTMSVPPGAASVVLGCFTDGMVRLGPLDTAILQRDRVRQTALPEPA